MSMESAAAVLTGLEAPTTQSSAAPAPQVPATGPTTLQEAVSPVKTPPAPGADRFAALAKKERALQRQMAELKAQQSKVSEYEAARKAAAQNPVKALEALGLTYEQLTQFLLNGNKPTPELEIASVKQEIERLRNETALKEKAAREAQEQAARAEYQRTLSEFNAEINDYVKSNADKYELTAMYQGESIVQATIEQHFNNTKKILSIQEATELVEKYFEEQVAAAQKTKKFQAKSQPKEGGQPKGEQAAKTSSPTLANELTSSAPSLLPAKTESDRLRRAMAALEQA